MAKTSPWGITLFDDTLSLNDYVAPFNTHAADLNAALNTASAGFFVNYATKAAMVAVPGTRKFAHSSVYADPTATNNGDYYWNGAAWTVYSEDTGWITPTLSGSWVSTAGMTVQYRRINGIVHLHGRATGGSGTMFVLPAGFRPADAAPSFLVQNGSVAGTACTVGMTSAGVVSGTSGTAPYLSNIPPFPAAG